MHRLAIFITDFGDGAVTVPLAAVTMVILFALRRPRLALGWGVSIAACAGTIGALKLALAACCHRSGLASPSGHVAMSAAVYGGLVLLLAGSLAPLERRAAAIGAALLVAAIAASRIALHEHSIAEVVIGLVVGGAALAALRVVVAAVPPGFLPVIWFGAAAAITIIVMHGTRWHTEGAIHALAGLDLFHALLPWCG